MVIPDVQERPKIWLAMLALSYAAFAYAMGLLVVDRRDNDWVVLLLGAVWVVSTAFTALAAHVGWGYIKEQRR